ncbi:MAG: cysteine--tRNA ligase, partial [Muribaculaceae bacterium]
IEPHASGHIIEQIEYIKKILDAGYAYVSEGSVYFDVPKFNHDHGYGKLSGRNIEELLATTRQLDGQTEKRNPTDFALWKKAAPEHIMHWPSPWSEGFPGWHLECSTMGEKYLGTPFDIHGGGMDLKFPHHECEIAQSVAHNGHESVHYWMHNNMITINGKKMGKSLGNFITLDEFFTGSHDLLSQAYSPMTIRFFILQAHYRGTVDFSNEALQASEKALQRMQEGYRRLAELKPSDSSTIDIADIERRCQEAMDDDLNTPIVIATLFDACRIINQVNDGSATATAADIDGLRRIMDTYLVQILGIVPDAASASGADRSSLKPYEDAVDLLLDIRREAKQKKDWATSDFIRDRLAAIGFDVKDTKDGYEWSVKQ